MSSAYACTWVVISSWWWGGAFNHCADWWWCSAVLMVSDSFRSTWSMANSSQPTPDLLFTAKIVWRTADHVERSVWGHWDSWNIATDQHRQQLESPPHHQKKIATQAHACTEDILNTSCLHTTHFLSVLHLCCFTPEEVQWAKCTLSSIILRWKG